MNLRLLTSLALCSLLLVLQASAQSKSLYQYHDLSSFYYKNQKDSLKKAWTCPVVFREKETQKKYKELWDDRSQFLTSSISDNSYIHDQVVYNYVQGIVSQLVNANAGAIPAQPFLLIDRSSSVNAYAVGNNIIAVNLGLIVYAHTREEIAFAIAHELAHNILNHVDNIIRQRAEWLTSQAYKDSLNAVLDSKYGRLSRLKKVYETYSFSRSRHQRYRESEADSLALVLLKRCNVSFDASLFLHLDSSDMQFKQPLKQPLKNYFTAYNVAFDESWTQRRSRGLSTKAYNFKDTTSIEDSLKTHPDCEQRYEATRAQTMPNGNFTPVDPAVRMLANKMMLWNLYNNENYTYVLYRIMLEKDKGNTDPWYDIMFSNVISSLQYSDRELHRFTAIGVVQKEYISRNFYELQNMLEQMPRESLEQYAKTMQEHTSWATAGPDEQTLKAFLHTLALGTDRSEDAKKEAARTLISANKSSIYCELAASFDK
ncbi:M48 family metalloprotease [Taibaiella soli]|uniref:Peptidase M48 Ste24p n=1 Tax=Taibaiella soli TaxID=1649169 RepID=A0A2W2AQE1_9BACT|nr:M48 family metalloprotease [Taibaiella soli]PZF74630.1 peptidase M48 Ste24p [Taibaiella soli]